MSDLNATFYTDLTSKSILKYNKKNEKCGANVQNKKWEAQVGPTLKPDITLQSSFLQKHPLQSVLACIFTRDTLPAHAQRTAGGFCSPCAGMQAGHAGKASGRSERAGTGTGKAEKPARAHDHAILTEQRYPMSDKNSEFAEQAEGERERERGENRDKGGKKQS